MQTARLVTRQVRAFGAAQSVGRWSHVEMGPKDPILGVSEAFQADPFPGKINLGVGAYRDDDGKPVVLPSILEAQNRVNDAGFNNEYAPIVGSAKFIDLSLDLAFGAQKPSHVAGLQALSGTGSLRLLAGYIARNWCGPLPAVYVSNPTWGNHHPIFNHMGIETKTYTYYDPSTISLNINGMLNDLRGAPDNSVILLHATAHNPTGVDPTFDQWKLISDACMEKGHLVVFDMAYQGFASGDCNKDAEGMRYFVEQGHKVCLLQSMAKNFGLYGQRIGCFSLMCEDEEEKARVMSQLKIVARAIWSSPPIHGARVVEQILGDDTLRTQWLGEVKDMADRIINMRELLTEGLQAEGSKKNWDHINSQIGMFCFSGMSGEMVDSLASDHHIYLTRNGRISMAGVTTKNVGPLAAGMHAVTK